MEFLFNALQNYDDKKRHDIIIFDWSILNYGD